jgi:hypothetical protein
VVKTDNAGALFLSQNSSTGVRSRHIDTRYHFFREYVEDRIVRVDSDILYKEWESGDVQETCNEISPEY